MPRASATAPLMHAIIDLLAGERRPLHAAEIASRLDSDERSVDRASLAQALEDLQFDGVLVARPGRRFALAAGARRDDRLVEGAFLANPRGFGFVRGSARQLDVFIPADYVGPAMHGDIVRARIVATTSRGMEGEVVEVLERRLLRVVGVLAGRPRQERLEPDDGRVRGPVEISSIDEGLAPRAGLAAVVEIDRYPEHPRELPRGRLVAVLGQPGEPQVEVAKSLVAHNIEESHPDEAVAEARAFGEDPSEADLEGRVDLTELPLLTIDPHDARDHDDAVWATRDEEGRYELWVAIADVSHYVTPGSALDKSALDRGTSIYLPDRAVPMLPRELSSTLCSLLEGKLRLCLFVHMQLDATGQVVERKVFEGYMRAHAYLTYPAVASALGLSQLASRDPRADSLRDELHVMWDLAVILRKRRMARGALDLDLPEVEIEVDPETSAPVRVSRRGGDPGVRKAYRLIEEFMLLANEAVAGLFIERTIPTIFRVHGAPDPEKIARLAAACEALGVSFDPEAADQPKALARFVRKVAAHPQALTIHGLTLRAMQQAMYDTTNIGHFGLASPAYLHFTSPIRRYPDLVVHRVLRETLLANDPRGGEGLAALRMAAARASELERNAMEVEREVSDVYRVLYMRSRVGERFDGVVSAITPAGVWVRLDDPFVDVLVPSDRLGEDSYEPDDLGVRAIGARSGDMITLGDPIRLEVEDVSITRRHVLGRRISHARATAGERAARKVGRRTKTARTTTERNPLPPRGPSKGRSTRTKKRAAVAKGRRAKR